MGGVIPEMRPMQLQYFAKTIAFEAQLRYNKLLESLYLL